MTDEEIFQLAEKNGWQDDFGRWNFQDGGLLDFVHELRQSLNVDAVNISQERVDETVKREHKPYGYVWTSLRDGMEVRFSRMPPNKFYNPQDTKPVYTAPQKYEWTPVEIGVDVNADGTHVVGMYVDMPEALRHVFYSKFHPAPPKREWVGLTDDERSYYLQAAANVGWWQASLFIEAQLKEKNT